MVANLALVGFAIGAASGPPHWMGRGFEPAAGLGRLMRFLPEERRRELLGEGAWRREFRGSLRDMRRAQHAIHAALAAEPFDRTALEQALGTFHELYVASQGRSHKAFADIVATLTPEERRQFVASLRPPRDGRNSRRPPRPPGDAPRPPPSESL